MEAEINGARFPALDQVAVERSGCLATGLEKRLADRQAGVRLLQLTRMLEWEATLTDAALHSH